MKKNYLLRPVFAKVGWGMLVLGSVILLLYCLDVLPEMSFPVFSVIPFSEEYTGTVSMFFGRNDVGDELGTVLVMTSLLLIAFSAERDEDEFTDALRLRSWFLAGITYGVIYIASDLLIYGIPYLYYIWFVQGGLMLLIYIVIFKVKLYRYRRACDDGQ